MGEIKVSIYERVKLDNKWTQVRSVLRDFCSGLLFGTSMGKPHYHLWDRLKAIAKRAGLDPATV
jgi:hypothetical protein